MCKNEFFQSSGRKTKLMYSLVTKTIFWPLIFICMIVLLHMA